MGELLGEQLEQDRDVEARFDEMVRSIDAAYNSLSSNEKLALEQAPQRKPTGSDDQGRQDEND